MEKFTQEVYATVTSGFFHNLQYFIKIYLSKYSDGNVKMKTFQKIKRYRIQKEMTQEELAEATNLSISYISQVETGRKKMGRVGLEKVAAALEVPVGRLLEPDPAAGENAKKNQILREVSDCDEYEMNIIYDTVLHLKKSLRKNRQ